MIVDVDLTALEQLERILMTSTQEIEISCDGLSFLAEELKKQEKNEIHFDEIEKCSTEIKRDMIELKTQALDAIKKKKQWMVEYTSIL